MNAEYLLDAIGRLDDDLVKEAEQYRRSRARYSALLGWAACFAVVLLLGYGVTHLGMGGGAPGGGNGAAYAPGGGTTASGDSYLSSGGHSNTNVPSAAEDNDPGRVFDQDAAQGTAPVSPGGDVAAGANGANPEAPHTQPDNNGDAGIELNGALFTIPLRKDASAERETLQLYSSGDRILDELPEGCVALGRLERPEGAQESPSTDAEEYVGCPVWLLMEDPETTVLYVELSGSRYLEFR